jgi:hypothetical protein
MPEQAYHIVRCCPCDAACACCHHNHLSNNTRGLDFDAAYTLTSPVGRAVAGSRERFRAALLSDPRYAAVLGHTRACSVHRTHSNASTYLEVLHITGADGGEE